MRVAVEEREESNDDRPCCAGQVYRGRDKQTERYNRGENDGRDQGNWDPSNARSAPTSIRPTMLPAMPTKRVHPSRRYCKRRAKPTWGCRGLLSAADQLRPPW